MSFVLDNGDTLIVWNDDGSIEGFPSDAVSDAEDALIAPGEQGATPTGPFFEQGSPEASFLVLRRMWPQAEVGGDAPVFEQQPDELDVTQPVQEAVFDPMKHPRGRAGEWIFKPGMEHDFENSDRVLRAMGALDLETNPRDRPDLYKTHPVSGFTVRNDKPRPTVRNEAGPPRIIETKANRFGNEEPVEGSERPPEHLYRAISEEDYQQALKTGHLKSDQRMNLADEGTVVAYSNPSFYLPGKLASSPHGEHLGRIVRIKYHEDDGWQHDPTDGYVKTHKPIPMERIDAAPQFVTTKQMIPSSITGNPLEHISTRPTGVGLEGLIERYHEAVGEATFDETLHPRDRLGRWRREPGLLHAFKHVAEGAKGSYEIEQSGKVWAARKNGRPFGVARTMARAKTMVAAHDAGNERDLRVLLEDAYRGNGHMHEVWGGDPAWMTEDEYGQARQRMLDLHDSISGDSLLGNDLRGVVVSSLNRASQERAKRATQ